MRFILPLLLTAACGSEVETDSTASSTGASEAAASVSSSASSASGAGGVGGAGGSDGGAAGQGGYGECDPPLNVDGTEPECDPAPGLACRPGFAPWHCETVPPVIFDGCTQSPTGALFFCCECEATDAR